MTTEWVITTPAERVELNANNQGEITFTVTNLGTAQDRVVFELVPGDGAAPGWFPPPDEPQRLIPGGGSVSYLAKIAVPAGTAVGTYSFQGRAYSADTAPEEGSRLSGRVAFDVKPSVQAKKTPWWPYAVAAGLVLVVLLVIGFLVLRSGGTPNPVPSASPSPTAAPKPTSTKPKLVSPVPGAVFGNFPRTTTFVWEAVPTAAYYRIEIQFCQSTACDADAKPWKTDTVVGTTYTNEFVGAQPGRWRVTSILASGDGETSNWQEFRYTV